MNVRLLLTCGTFCAFFALTAVAAAPFNALRLQGDKMLHVPLGKGSHPTPQATASSDPPAYVSQPFRVDSHITHWITIDVPAAGPIGTFPQAINDFGEITGNYNDASPAQVQHGFLRTADGAIVSFDPPGSQLTVPQVINNEGTVLGYFFDAAGSEHGFTRARNGNFKTFDEPNAGASAFSATQPNGINDLGAIVGVYADANGDNHGFLREPNRSFITIDAPGTSEGTVLATQCASINLEGVLGCQYLDTAGTWHALLRYPGGTFVTVDAPGSGTGGGDLGTFTGFLQAVNDFDQMTGEYADPNNGYHGYVRNAAGRFVEFTVPGGGADNANGTYPFSMNIWGLVTGFSADPNGNVTAFVRFADGTLDSFQAPGQGNLATYAYIGNALDQIVGLFVDSNGTGHGFIALATP
jgi:hypothetical protein